MSLVTSVGKSLFNVGTKAVKIAAKHPGRTAITTFTGIGAYEVASGITKAKKEIKEKKSTLSNLLKIGVAVGAAVLLRKAGTKLMQNPEIKEVVSKLAEKSKVLKENLKNFFNNAGKVVKSKI